MFLHIMTPDQVGIFVRCIAGEEAKITVSGVTGKTIEVDTRGEKVPYFVREVTTEFWQKMVLLLLMEREMAKLYANLSQNMDGILTVKSDAKLLQLMRADDKPHFIIRRYHAHLYLSPLKWPEGCYFAITWQGTRCVIVIQKNQGTGGQIVFDKDGQFADPQRVIGVLSQLAGVDWKTALSLLLPLEMQLNS